MPADMHEHKEVISRPTWREEYLHDLPALERYSAEMRAWQRQSDDPLDRAEAELWSRLTANEACAVFNRTLEVFASANMKFTPAKHAMNR
jgi:hypothetical protein